MPASAAALRAACSVATHVKPPQTLSPSAEVFWMPSPETSITGRLPMKLLAAMPCRARSMPSAMLVLLPSVLPPMAGVLLGGLTRPPGRVPKLKASAADVSCIHEVACTEFDEKKDTASAMPPEPENDAMALPMAAFWKAAL